MLKQKRKLETLLEESLESFYWLGFLLADGYFMKSNRIRVVLADKDKQHLQKFCDFVRAGRVVTKDKFIEERNFKFCNWSVMDTHTVSLLKNKYSISHNKTENPPDLNSLNDDQKFALFIGFIDGDGCIAKQSGRLDSRLQIQCHRSWKDVLEFLSDVKVKINSRGYSLLSITNNEILRKMKQRAIALGLPFLDRKWDVIDLSLTSRLTSAKILKENITYLKSIGMRQTDIAKQLDCSVSRVSIILKG